MSTLRHADRNGTARRVRPAFDNTGARSAASSRSTSSRPTPESPRGRDGPRGDFIVVWTASGRPGGARQGSALRRRRRPRAAEFQVNTTEFDALSDPDVALDSTGQAIVVLGEPGRMAQPAPAYSASASTPRQQAGAGVQRQHVHDGLPGTRGRHRARGRLSGHLGDPFQDGDERRALRPALRRDRRPGIPASTRQRSSRHGPQFSRQSRLDAPTASSSSRVRAVRPGRQGRVAGFAGVDADARPTRFAPRLRTDAADRPTSTACSSPARRVVVEPAWRNPSTAPLAFTGPRSTLTGPRARPTRSTTPRPTTATSPAGGTGDCHDATGDCYRVTRLRRAARAALGRALRRRRSTYDGVHADVRRFTSATASPTCRQNRSIRSSRTSSTTASRAAAAAATTAPAATSRARRWRSSS